MWYLLSIQIAKIKMMICKMVHMLWNIVAVDLCFAEIICALVIWRLSTSHTFIQNSTMVDGFMLFLTHPSLTLLWPLFHLYLISNSAQATKCLVFYESHIIKTSGIDSRTWIQFFVSALWLFPFHCCSSVLKLGYIVACSIETYCTFCLAVTECVPCVRSDRV